MSLSYCSRRLRWFQKLPGRAFDCWTGYATTSFYSGLRPFRPFRNTVKVGLDKSEINFISVSDLKQKFAQFGDITAASVHTGEGLDAFINFSDHQSKIDALNTPMDRIVNSIEDSNNITWTDKRMPFPFVFVAAYKPSVHSVDRLIVHLSRYGRSWGLEITNDPHIKDLSYLYYSYQSGRTLATAVKDNFIDHDLVCHVDNETNQKTHVRTWRLFDNDYSRYPRKVYVSLNEASTINIQSLRDSLSQYGPVRLLRFFEKQGQRYFQATFQHNFSTLRMFHEVTMFGKHNMTLEDGTVVSATIPYGCNTMYGKYTLKLNDVVLGAEVDYLSHFNDILDEASCNFGIVSGKYDPERKLAQLTFSNPHHVQMASKVLKGSRRIKVVKRVAQPKPKVQSDANTSV